MRVLLINPPTSNVYAQFGADLPPLGLAYLAAVLRKAGHCVCIVDLGIEPKGLHGIDLSAYDVVGISADTPRFPAAVAIAKEVKKQKCIVVMGGYHVTFMDEEALDTGVVDYVVRGEGEEIFLNLVNVLEGSGDPEGINGISYANGRSIIRNRAANPPHDLDHLPLPARDLLPLSQYNATFNGMPLANLITSRGCPFNCYFCASSRFGGLKWRARTPVSIVEEIEQIQSDFGYRAFAFVDDNFTLNSKRVIEFADELNRRNIHIIWWCFSRADTLANNESLVKYMAEAGAQMVFLGLESGSEEVLQNYDKGLKTEQARQAIAILKKYGISIYGSFIIGAIHETKKMIQHSIRWAKQLQLDVVQFSILTPYPGTAIFRQAEQENRLLHRCWELYDGVHAVMRIDHLQPDEIQKLFVQAYRKFYFSLSNLLRSSREILRYKVPIKMIFRRILSFVRLRDLLNHQNI